MLDLHPGLMIWTIISFVILLYILNKAAWKPILKALDEREKGIKDDINTAKTAREKAESSLEEYRKQLAEAQSEAQKIVAKSREDAERIGEELKAKYQADAEALLEKARKQIDLESQAAINEIRNEVAGLAIVTAEKIIGKALDSEDHRRLVSESLMESPN
ncbi:MAG: F0F1 ATP synthase subunit B [Candidatus Hatepunaea meridiana]|nr:F0F1 ATP synthase subunit B [Candidatus Hatepunaea meridiana]